VDLPHTAKYDYNNPAFSSATGHFTQVSSAVNSVTLDAHSLVCPHFS
jgi:hypothetical protein